MPAVTRVDPKTIFTPDEWARISRQSVWVGPVLVLSAWAVIIGAGVLFTLETTLARYTEHWMLPVGILLLVVVLATKGGLMALIRKITGDAK